MDTTYLPAEARARLNIDRQLIAAGWVVQSYKDLNLYAGPGVAVREFVLDKPHGRVDYLLFLNARPAGVIEAKPEGTTLVEVEHQSGRYVEGRPAGMEPLVDPLPFIYESTGVETRFTNGYDRKPPSETPWTRKLWIYDLRTNQSFTLKTRQLGRADLDDFVRCHNPENRHEREETERLKAFSYDELVGRDKASLDIFWLRDESLEDADSLPPPHVIAAEIVEDLEAALAQFAEIAETLVRETAN